MESSWRPASVRGHRVMRNQLLPLQRESSLGRRTGGLESNIEEELGLEDKEEVETFNWS